MYLTGPCICKSSRGFTFVQVVENYLNDFFEERGAKCLGLDSLMIYQS